MPEKLGVPVKDQRHVPAISRTKRGVRIHIDLRQIVRATRK